MDAGPLPGIRVARTVGRATLIPGYPDINEHNLELL